MKSLALFALSAIASASALAVTPITVGATLTQYTSVDTNATIQNTAAAGSTAIQSVSSNKGYITLAGGGLEQKTYVNGQSDITNESKAAGDIAVQNVSSNYGKVAFSATSSKSTQTTTLNGKSTLSNETEGGAAAGAATCPTASDCNDAAQAMQNVSSNANDVVVNGTLDQSTTLHDSTVKNIAKGKHAIAQQQLSSNVDGVKIFNGGTKVDQLTSLKSATVINTAAGSNAEAVQNLASNYRDVSISGDVKQRVWLDEGSSNTVTNTANSSAKAIQNLASNILNVTVNGTGSTDQTVDMNGSNIQNSANGQNVAVQNLASNAGGVTVDAALTQAVTGNGGVVKNEAIGVGAQAFQNLASNLGPVTINSTTSQTVAVSGGIYNKANSYAVAVQNISSNDACEPPKLWQPTMPGCPTGNCWTTTWAQ